MRSCKYHRSLTQFTIQNAVNMVKVLLKAAPKAIDEVDAEPEPFLNELLQDIMNTQNGQIMTVDS